MTMLVASSMMVSHNRVTSVSASIFGSGDTAWGGIKRVFAVICSADTGISKQYLFLNPAERISRHVSGRDHFGQPLAHEGGIPCQNLFIA
jgi:hypothetical protein